MLRQVQIFEHGIEGSAPLVELRTHRAVTDDHRAMLQTFQELLLSGQGHGLWPDREFRKRVPTVILKTCRKRATLCRDPRDRQELAQDGRGQTPDDMVAVLVEIDRVDATFVCPVFNVMD